LPILLIIDLNLSDFCLGHTFISIDLTILNVTNRGLSYNEKDFNELISKVKLFQKGPDSQILKK
jgi:hypothetical protein